MGGRGSNSRIPTRQVQPTPPQPQAQPITQVSDADSLKAMDDYMKDNYNVRLDVPSLSKLDETAVRDAVQGVEDVLKEFPQAQSVLNVVRAQNLKKGVMANASFRGSITMGNHYFDTQQHVDASYNRSVRNKFHPQGTTYKEILAHETGHILERALIEKYELAGNSNNAWAYLSAVNAWGHNTYSSKVITEAVKAAKKTPGGKGKLTAQLISDVSGYATKNRSEALAECVADYRANGNNAKPLSVEVWKILKRELG